MREIETDNVRTIGIFGQSSAGKTSLGEAIIYNAKATNRLGRVDDKTNILSSSPEEMERKITINLSVFSFEYENALINVIDTPGYDDFYGEVLCGIRASDIAIIVIDPNQEIGIVTEKAFSTLIEEKVPVLFFVSKVKEGMDTDAVLSNIKSVFKNVVPAGMFDKGNVVLAFDKDSPHYNDLIEAIIETDDALLERYLSDEKLKDEELKGAFYSAIRDGKIFPLFMGDSISGVGIKELLSLLIKIPLNKESGEMLGFMFKTTVDPHLGDLRYIKVLKGELSPGIKVYNCIKGAEERINQVYVVKGREREEVSALPGGGVGGLVKLKNTSTGDTLRSIRGESLPAIDFPKPLVSVAIVPQEKRDEEKIMEALSKLNEEDPSFKYYYDKETKQTILSGRGELHVDIIIAKLKRKYEVTLTTQKPKIHYRETIKQPAEAQGKFKRQTGGHGQYGDCWIKIEPFEGEDEFEFVNAIVGGAIPSKYLPSIEKGIKEAMQEGILTAYPMVNLKATCYDGTFHSVDSSDIAFKIAGSIGFKNACEKADVTILEPIVSVEVTIPEKYLGDVMGDLNSRRGKILGTEAQGRFQKIKANVPEADLFGFSASIRSITGGRGTYTQKFLHYEGVPRDIQAKIIEESKKK